MRSNNGKDCHVRIPSDPGEDEARDEDQHARQCKGKGESQGRQGESQGRKGEGEGEGEGRGEAEAGEEAAAPDEGPAGAGGPLSADGQGDGQDAQGRLAGG